MRIAARAKINWTLDIVGKREDGYHLMDMLMQPISLADDITLLPQEELTLSVSGFPRVNPGPENLALRAAVLLKQATGYTGGASIHVHKRIPVGAGMGGGSADAAGVLAGLEAVLLGHRLDASGAGNAGLAARCGRALLSARRASACAGCRGASHAAALRRALLAGRHSALSGVEHEGSLQSFFIRGL